MFDSYQGIYSLTLPDVFAECYKDSVALAESLYDFETWSNDLYLTEAHAVFLENLYHAYSRNYGDWRMVTTAVCLATHASALLPSAGFAKWKSDGKVVSQMRGVVKQDADILIALMFGLHVYGFELGQQPSREFIPVRTASLLNMISLRDIRMAVDLVRKTRNRAYVTGDGEPPRMFGDFVRILRKFRHYDLL